MKLFHKKDTAAASREGAGTAVRRRIKHPRLLVFGAIAAVIALAAGILIPRSKAAAGTASSEDLTLARTVTLEKGSLDSTVGVSGVVRSNTVSTVTTALTAKVTAVNVAVGDKVKKGDVICTLDTTDLDKQILDKQTQLQDANKQLRDDLTRLQGQLDRAKSARTQAQTTQDALVSGAAAARDNAKKALDPAQAALTAAKAQMDTANATIAPYNTALTNAQAARETAYAAWQAAGAKTQVSDTDTTAPADYTAYLASEQAVKDAQDAQATAKNVYSYDSISAAYAAAQTTYSTLSEALTAAQAALDSATATRQSTLGEQDNTIADLAAQVTAAAEKVKKGTSDSELQDLLEKRKSATLTAETDGEVTELNVTVGSVPKDAVAKIQSTTDLVLRVTISEADINRVSVGLPVRITADSISGTVSGTLSRISPTADAGDSSAGASTTGYSADIAIADPQGLHIGSKANGDIVLSSKSDVFTVPIDAVGVGTDGKSYIRSMQADGTTVNVPVTTGEKNDYSIEVSGDGLREGMSVLADANWTALADSAAANQSDGMVF